jgi:aminoglycoside 6'-N-acetyltransferase
MTHASGRERRVNVRGTKTTLRPAEDGDVDLLVAWHADPEVRRFWDDKIYTPDTMRAKLARPNFEPFLVEEAGQPVGYIQAWWEPGTEDAGLDMFLAPEARGRGLGPDAARTLARHLVARGWTRVTTDPYVWNERGVRAWRRAGFADVEERDPDEGHTARWLLMEFRP